MVDCSTAELYTQCFQKLIYLRLFTDCFVKISLQSSEQTNVFVLQIEDKSSLKQSINF